LIFQVIKGNGSIVFIQCLQFKEICAFLFDVYMNFYIQSTQIFDRLLIVNKINRYSSHLALKEKVLNKHHQQNYHSLTTFHSITK